MGDRKESYRLSTARIMILRHLMNDVYSEHPEGVSQQKPEEYGIQEFPAYYRYNDVTGIVRAHYDGLFSRGPLIQKENEGSESQYEGILNQQNVRKTLESYVSKGILVKDNGHNVRNRKLYFPNETEEGFRSFVDVISEYSEFSGGPIRVRPETDTDGILRSLMKQVTGSADYFNGTYQVGDILLGSWFSHIMVNRNLILSRLKNLGVQVTLYLDSEDEHYRITVPVVGHYPRVYEDTEQLESFVSDCRVLLEYISSLDDAEIALDLKSADRELLKDRKFRRNAKHVKEVSIGYLSEVINSFEKEIGTLNRITEETQDGFNPRFWFENDPDGTRRSESTWADLLLDEDDLEMVRSNARVEMLTQNEWHPLADDSVEKELLTEEAFRWYPSLIDEYAILPTLCLLQTSPSALIMFAVTESSWGKGIGRLDLHPGTTEVLNRDLMRAAISDILAGRNKGYGARWPTKYNGFGEFLYNGTSQPSLLYFSINVSRYLSFRGGRLVPPTQEAYYDLSFEIGTNHNGCIATVLGSTRYSTFAFEHLNKTSVRTDYFGTLANEIPSLIRKMLRYRIIYGQMPGVFRPHNSV